VVQQHIWRAATSECPAICRRIAETGLNRNRKVHLFDRSKKVARDIGRQRFQRTNVKRVETRPWRFGESDLRGQQSRKRLAATGRRDQQHPSPPCTACGIETYAGAASSPDRRTMKRKVLAMFQPLRRYISFGAKEVGLRTLRSCVARTCSPIRVAPTGDL
jgi:hypothetical protein